MATIRIIAPPKGQSVGPTEERAVFEGEVTGGSRLWVDDGIASDLVELFGDGFMEYQFHVIWNGVMYEDCRIVNIGSGAELSCLTTRQWSD